MFACWRSCGGAAANNARGLIVAHKIVGGVNRTATTARVATQQQQARRQPCWSPRFLATSTTTVRYCSVVPDTFNDSTASSSQQQKEQQRQQQHDLYMWGTDDGNTRILKSPSFQLQPVLDVPTLVRLDVNHTNDDNNNGNNHRPWHEWFLHVQTSGGGIRQVVCGPTDTAFLLHNGQCFVMGENKQGQLGVGHQQPVTVPTLVELPFNQGGRRGIEQASLGINFSAFVDTEGDLYTTGFGGSAFSGMGFLGHGTEFGGSGGGGGDENDASRTTDAATTKAVVANHIVRPKLVESLLEDGCAIQQVSVSELHMTCLTTEGEVLTTGAGSYGRLGNYDTTDQLYLEPVEVLTPESKVISIAGGKSFTLALTQDGVLYSWGRNHKGQLGTGLGLAVDIYAMQAVPEPIGGGDGGGGGGGGGDNELVGRRVVKMAAGHSHAACITSDGRLFYWGMSLHYDPVPIQFNPEDDDDDNVVIGRDVMVDVACGEDYTLAVDRQGTVYSWGIAPRRRGSSSSSSRTPGATTTSSGSQSSTTTTTTNRRRTTNGVLGQGSQVARLNQATRIRALQGCGTIQQLSAGWNHAACLVTPPSSASSSSG